MNRISKIFTFQERSWIIYDWASSAYSMAITTAILPIFFKDVIAKGLPDHLSTAYWGYGNTLSTILISLLAPILGAIADYKGYKKKLFVAFLVCGAAFTALLSTVSEGEWLKCIVIYAVSAIGFSGAAIFYDAFLVDITKEDRMDWVSSIGFAFGYIGSTIPFILSITLILKPSIIGVSSTIDATRLSFLITALWWLIFSLPILRNVKQIYYIDPSPNPILDSFKRLYSTFRDIKGYNNIFMFLLAYFFYIDGVDTIIKMAGVYGRDIGISSNNLLIILLVIQFIAFPCAILYGKLAEKFSAKSMLLFGIATYVIITIFAFFIKTTLHYWILAVLVATSQGGIQALSRSFFGKIIPKEKSSEFFGIYNIFGRFAAIIGPLLVAIFTQIFGNSRLGVLSLLILFFVGGSVLLKVKEK